LLKTDELPSSQLKVRERESVVGKPNPIQEGMATKLFTFAFSAVLDILASCAPSASQAAFAADQDLSVEKLL
jgi:hypothetical protein